MDFQCFIFAGLFIHISLYMKMDHIGKLYGININFNLINHMEYPICEDFSLSQNCICDRLPTIQCILWGNIFKPFRIILYVVVFDNPTSAAVRLMGFRGLGLTIHSTVCTFWSAMIKRLHPIFPDKSSAILSVLLNFSNKLRIIFWSELLSTLNFYWKHVMTGLRLNSWYFSTTKNVAPRNVT